MSILDFLLDRYIIKQPRLRRVLTRWVYGAADRTVELLGGRFRINTAEEAGYYRAYLLSRRNSLFRDEVPVMLTLAFLLADADIFADIGANIGMYGVSFARFRRLNPALRVIAFEASPGTYMRLKENADACGVEAINVALGDLEGRLPFFSGAVSHVFSAKKSTYSMNGEAVYVATRRLDSFDLPGSNMVLKVDVEGMEYEVLAGAEMLLRSGRVKAVYVDGYEDDRLPSLLTGFGYELLDGRTLMPISGKVHSLLALRQTTRSDREPWPSSSA